VDDVLATGGTARAAGAIVARLGGTVHGYAFLVELQFLNGRKRIDGAEVFSLIQYAA
jgi:adenine phosphoribosyltransferase